ncbi:ABC transporter ATP-binding protein [Corynebacterium mayonis]|uniref:ABC transporter ATP-binding protein n=1 Tax=Corynebacterium mayonis TaxID=3062461 RepID=UPI003140588C
MIEAHDLTKVYGEVRAVDGLSFSVKPGVVTGFLGPNGSGKSTTMRMMVGLDTPTKGYSLIDATPYRALKEPARKVGALLDARSAHPNRSARNHLLWQAHAAGLPTSRVDEVLDLVGLTNVAAKKVGGFSLGMGQRLGIASAMLGDPEILILDEPVNGLDPEGIRWVRSLLKSLAAEGRTILLSSHLLAEMAQTADHLIVIGRGKLVADTTVEAFINDNSSVTTLVRTTNPDALENALAAANIAYTRTTDSAGRPQWSIEGHTSEEIGELAFNNHLPLSELSERRATLEDAYMHSTEGHAQYTSKETPDA